ncbi:DNA-binding response regulator [Neiella marina]|uniref:DNA-binding response regulator n=1 Tax=Neiella marina TaxID=508461 RepID=A0A8J2XPR9_9GAMM|nr:response regulator [Neiella marina]GGA89027.1 DNA-binding response regulator [Neiella marina]
MNRVLLIDDDTELASLLTELLQYEGYQIDAVHDGQTGLQKGLEGQHELILLDVMLPQLNGFEVLKQLRQQSTVPVIMLTARGEPADRVLGLEHGADDYLPKPFTEAELVARMKAVLRRYQPAQDLGDGLLSAGVSVNIAKQTAHWQHQDLSMTSAELAILACLMENPGQPVDKETLSLRALGRRMMPFDRSIDMHVSHVRKKLAEYLDEVPIKTLRGRGYSWSAEVVRSS